MSIIRGGQNLLHYFRMFDQVLKSLFFVVLLVALLVFGWLLYQDVSLYDFKIYFIYLISKCYVGLGVKNLMISFNNSFGELQRYKVIDIVNNPLVVKSFYRINAKVIIDFFIGLKWGIYCAIATIFLFAIKGHKLGKKKALRGKDLVNSSVLKWKIKLYNLNRFCFKTIKVAGISYPNDYQKTHTLITGASGSGKTVVISDIISQLRKNKQKAIIYDKMGVYVEKFYNPKTDILLNPLDERSVNWNLLKECGSSATLDAISKAFIPSTKSSDPFWENAARIVFSETLNYLKKQDRTSNKDLQNIYFGSDQTEFNRIINSSGILNKILSKDSERTTGSILSVMISYVRCLKYLSIENDKNNFSIKNWIENDQEQGFLIISSTANNHETLKPLISVFLELAINNLLSLPKNQNRQIWLFLDELPSLHYLPSLQSGLSESRQFGGSFVLSMQLMAQLRSIYGKDLAESVSGLCRNRVVFSTPDEETANWCSGSLGKIEVEETKENYSYGANQMRDGVTLNKVQQIRPLVLPAEIMNLKDLNCYVAFSGFPITKSKVKYKDYPSYYSRFIAREESGIIEEIESEAIILDHQTQITNETINLSANNQQLAEPVLTEEELEEDEDAESNLPNNNNNFV
jgi:type IV conjugative transfer system coupling protein TraD